MIMTLQEQHQINPEGKMATRERVGHMTCRGGIHHEFVGAFANQIFQSEQT